MYITTIYRIFVNMYWLLGHPSLCRFILLRLITRSAQCAIMCFTVKRKQHCHSSKNKHIWRGYFLSSLSIYTSLPATTYIFKNWYKTSVYTLSKSVIVCNSAFWQLYFKFFSTFYRDYMLQRRHCLQHILLIHSKNKNSISQITWIYQTNRQSQYTKPATHTNICVDFTERKTMIKTIIKLPARL